MSLYDDQMIAEILDDVYKRLKLGEITFKQNNKDLLEVITELQQEILKQREQIKDLQDTVADFVLLTGQTESINN